MEEREEEKTAKLLRSFEKASMECQEKSNIATRSAHAIVSCERGAGPPTTREIRREATKNCGDCVLMDTRLIA